MPYEIVEKEDLVEVRLSGETTRWELMEAIHHLHRRDPCKKTSDLWVVSADVVVPAAWHALLVSTTKNLCTPDMVGARTAILAADQLHKAQFDMYRTEAQRLPFEIKVFTSRKKAERWLARSKTRQPDKVDNAEAADAPTGKSKRKPRR